MDNNNLLAKNNETIFDRIKNRLVSFWKRIIKNIDLDLKKDTISEEKEDINVSEEENKNEKNIIDNISNYENNYSNDIDQKIKEINLNNEREKFLKNLINNPELFDAMSKENLIMLNKYYDHLISENERKIRKIKNN